MKKWQQRFLAIATLLGFNAKVNDGTLTAQEQKEIFSSYEEKYGVTFTADREADEDVEEPTPETVLTAEEISTLADLMGVAPESVPTNPTAAAQVAAQRAATLERENEVLRNEPEPSAVVRANASPVSPSNLSRVLGHTPHTASHLFGIEHELFARGKWHNDLMITRKSSGTLTEAEAASFRADFSTYASVVSKRAAELDSNNMLGTLNYADMIKGNGTIDYSELFNTAGEYIVRRSDLILAYLRSLPSVSHIFPVVSHVQNKELAPSANFGELSQGYRKGRIFKGNVSFAAEIYSVVDVMFKFLFEDLIKLEKQYIGYLNREGSAIIKWSFIEWVMVHFGEILISEQNRRRIVGCRVPQQAVESNPAMLAADGVLRAIERVEEENKVLPFEDYGVYDQDSILDLVEGMWDKVTQILPTTDGYKIYVNAKHKQWYLRAHRAKYGQDNDFAGSAATPVTDCSVNIVWVPNMPMNCYKVWITRPGNIETYEDLPGEMMRFEFLTEFEGVAVKSRWKEGAGLLQAGVKYATKAELEASEYEHQYIFTNYPVSDLALAETVSFKENSLFAISGTTTVTTVSGASTERVYKLVAKAKGDTIAKSGAFEKIQDAFSAGAAGDYIKVYAELEDQDVVVDGETVKVSRPTGKFLELERKVSKS